MLRCGGQRLKLGVSPSSMLPYLFEAVHLTEPRGDQCASLVGQNVQGFSLLPRQLRREPLCPAFIWALEIHTQVLLSSRR